MKNTKRRNLMRVILPTTVRLVLNNMLKNKIVLHVHIVPNLITRNPSCMIEPTQYSFEPCSTLTYRNCANHYRSRKYV